MRFVRIIILSVVLVVSGCTGYGSSIANKPIISACVYGDFGTIESEIPLDCDMMNRNIHRIYGILSSVGINRRFDVYVKIRDTTTLDPNDSHEEVSGFYREFPIGSWIELTRDGDALLHELIHSTEHGSNPDHKGWTEHRYRWADVMYGDCDELIIPRIRASRDIACGTWDP